MAIPLLDTYRARSMFCKSARPTLLSTSDDVCCVEFDPAHPSPATAPVHAIGTASGPSHRFAEGDSLPLHCTDMDLRVLLQTS